jgi:hypothetical protein
MRCRGRSRQMRVAGRVPGGRRAPPRGRGSGADEGRRRRRRRARAAPGPGGARPAHVLLHLALELVDDRREAAQHLRLARVGRGARVVAEQWVEQQRHVLPREQRLHGLTLALVHKHLFGRWEAGGLGRGSGRAWHETVSAPAPCDRAPKGRQRGGGSRVRKGRPATCGAWPGRRTSMSFSTLRFTPRMYLTPLLRAAWGPPVAISAAMKSA